MLTKERAIEELRRLFKIAKYGKEHAGAIVLADGKRTVVGLQVPIDIVEAIVREEVSRG